VANKSDLKANRACIDPKRGQQLANKYNVKFMETSASTGENVNNTFTLISEEILIQKYPKLHNREKIDLNHSMKAIPLPSQEKKGGCC
jgi:GTPase SAR1 family protein